MSNEQTINPSIVHNIPIHPLKSLFTPKPIKQVRTKWETTLGKRKSWETRALSKITIKPPAH